MNVVPESLLVERCTRCGRTTGLSEPVTVGSHVVIACDCNYQHIRELPLPIKPVPGIHTSPFEEGE